MSRSIGYAAFGLYLLGMAVAVGWPDGWEVNRAVVRVHFLLVGIGIPVPWGPGGTAVALNVLACIPPVAAAVVLFRRPPWWVWVLIGIGLSAAVETVQWLGPVGRHASVWDVVANGSGALLGGLLGAWLRPAGRQGQQHTSQTP